MEWQALALACINLGTSFSNPHSLLALQKKFLMLKLKQL
jgi:hypothetical protein